MHREISKRTGWARREARSRARLAGCFVNGVFIWLCGFSAVAHASELVFENPNFLEGDTGSNVHEIEVLLDQSSRQPVRIGFSTRAASATVGEDFQAAMGELVFVPGALEPGLPGANESEDPLTRALVLAEGFGVDVLAELDDPVGLAFPPQESPFGDSLYAASLNQNGIGVSDYLVRINFLGEIEDFVALFPEADPTSLEFAPTDSRYGDYLYVSANNRDGSRPGDQGGTIQRVDIDGNVVDLTPIGIPFGPGEPGELAFGIGTDFGDLLFLANSVGSPGDILGVLPDGALSIVVDDGLFEDQDSGLAPRSLAIDLQGNYGGLAYFGEFGRRCSCLKKLYPDGRVEAFVDSLPGDPHAIAFAPDGPFEGHMFVALDDGAEGSVVRVLPSGEILDFVSGLQGFLIGNGKDVIEFSHDGSVMYLADYYGDRIYRIAPSTVLQLEIVGDVKGESDEAVYIDFESPTLVGLDHEAMLVTIIDDDDGDLPPAIEFESEIRVLEDSGAHAFFVGLQDDQTPLDVMMIDVALQDSELMRIQRIRRDETESGVWIEFETISDRFGRSTLELKVLDSLGQAAGMEIPVTVDPVNDPPSLLPISDVHVPLEQSLVEVGLEGIGSGADNELDRLGLSVSIQGSSPLPSVSVVYTSPDDTGQLLFAVDDAVRVDGSGHLVEVVLDDNSDAESFTRQQFRLTYEAIPSIEPPEDQDPIVRILSPEPFQIIVPDLSFHPLLATVPIRFQAIDDRRIDRVEIYANDRRIGEVQGGSEAFLWDEVEVGDYRLMVVAFDDAGQQASSDPVDFAVSGIAGRIAIVRNHSAPEIRVLTEYLYEIGYETDLYRMREWEVSELDAYDLIIWHQSAEEAFELDEVRLAAMHALHDSGIPFYFIGAGPSQALSESWSNLTGFGRIPDGPDSIQAAFSGEAVEEIQNGRYGRIGEAAFEIQSGFGVAETFGSFVVAGTRERAAMVAYPGPDDVNGGGVRKVSQVFSILGPHSQGREALFRSLFQNSVCWLLRCAPCNAVDLELIDPEELEVSGRESQIAYRVKVKHSGECEGTGVKLDLEIPDGARIAHAASSRGVVQVEPSGLRFELGRMASASEALLEWTVDFSRSGEVKIMANLTSNNVEVTDLNNRFEWTSSVVGLPSEAAATLQIRMTPLGGLEISVDALQRDPGAVFQIQRSQDLRAWETWKSVSAGNWESISSNFGVGGQFFRAFAVD